MSLVALGAAIGLATYAAFSTLGGLVAVAIWWLLSPAAAGADPARRAALLLGLRTGPALLGATAVFGLVLPAFILYEPRVGVEPVGLPLLALAGLGAALLGAGAWRGVRDEKSTRDVARLWGARARTQRLASDGEPALVFDWPFPVVSVIGRRAPRLFVERRVLEACSREELEAVVRHERAHVAGSDNLKRTLMRACPDLLGLTPLAERLERDWSDATESAADEMAAGDDPGRRVALASAILKLARLATSPPLPVAGSAVFDGTPIERRVRRLLEAELVRDRTAALLALVSAAALALLVFGMTRLDRIHELTELAVARLG